MSLVIRWNRQASMTVALLAMSLTPTCWVVWTVWHVQSPLHARAVETALSSTLGARVRIGSVTHPKPGRMVVRDFVRERPGSSDDGSGFVASASRLETTREHNELVVDVETLELRGASPRQAVRELVAIPRDDASNAPRRVTIAVERCRINFGDGLLFELFDCACILQHDAGGPVFTMSCRLGEGATSTRCEATATRDRSTRLTSTRLTFKTMEGPAISTRFLDVFLDAGGWFGPAATFEGELIVSLPDAADPSIEFNGTIHDVDLGALVASRFPNERLEGRARLTIDRARWGDRRGQGFGWLEARGEIVSGPGSIGVPLLRSLVREMGFRAAPKLANLDPSRRDLDFRALGLSFAINPDGRIALDGALGEQNAPDAVLTDAADVLARAPDRPSNVAGLIKTLHASANPPAGSLVPLTAESKLLMTLPVPTDAEVMPTLVPTDHINN